MALSVTRMQPGIQTFTRQAALGRRAVFQGGSAAGKTAVAVAEKAATSSIVKPLVKFLTSKETFYKFWTQMLATGLSGAFLLIATRMKSKPGISLPGNKSLPDKPNPFASLPRVEYGNTTPYAGHGYYYG